jgi:hypothetical protein
MEAHVGGKEKRIKNQGCAGMQGGSGRLESGATAVAATVTEALRLRDGETE